jgi:diacylglycerol kinase family enzyme
MDICVVFNPAAARDRAGPRLDELRRRLGRRAEFRPTEAPGDAESLALDAARSGFGCVAAAGGDGTVHGVANGLLRSERPNVALAVVPLGSANDYAHMLGLDFERALDFGPGRGERRVDVGWVRAGQRESYFINTMGMGFSGAVTLESRRVRRLSGVLLYGAGFLKALWKRYACPQTEVVLDGALSRGPMLSLTLAIGRREGNLVVAREAAIDDGLFDYLLVGSLSRLAVLRALPRLVTGARPPEDPAIRLGRCRDAGVRSAAPLITHLDGELFTVPEDDACVFEVRCLPGRLRVLA